MAGTIGFIGLGIMGKPMALNLLKAGYKVVAYNRSQAAVEAVTAEGATAAASPREVAEQSDVVITMLPDSPDVSAVVTGDDGILAGARAGALIIDMSTIAPGVAQQLAAAALEQGIHMLDAPVSGGDKGAITGTLSIMVGGAAEDFTRARPIFEALGRTITHCGPSGAGQTVKACNQVAVALNIAAVSEALVLGTKAGVDPEIIIKVLSGGLAHSRVLELRGLTMANHAFEPGFKALLHRKDMGIILQTAHEVGAALPLSAIVNQMFTSLIARGDGDLDHSALLTIIETLSNHSTVMPDK